MYTAKSNIKNSIDINNSYHKYKFHIQVCAK